MPTSAQALLRSPRVVLAATLVLLAACERRQNPPATDSTVPMRPAPQGPGTATATTWDSRLGPVLLIGGSSPTLATVVVPDSVRSGGETVTEKDALTIRSSAALLMGRSDSVQLGILQDAKITRDENEEECTGWPSWHIAPAKSVRSGALASWTVGVVGSAPRPIRLESIENMSRADSARLAAEATRLASTLPSVNSDRLAGLPFTVTTLWRFPAAPGVEGIAANLVRRVNQEARPLEEHTLLIAERDSSRRDERFGLAYHDRTQGAEETVESRDVLAAMRATTDAQPMLIIARDFGDGSAYAIVERDPSGRWRDRWHSARGHCR